jgi:hypothetical protein
MNSGDSSILRYFSRTVYALRKNRQMITIGITNSICFVIYNRKLKKKILPIK